MAWIVCLYPCYYTITFSNILPTNSWIFVNKYHSILLSIIHVDLCIFYSLSFSLFYYCLPAHGVIITGLWMRYDMLRGAQFDLFAGHRYDTRWINKPLSSQDWFNSLSVCFSGVLCGHNLKLSPVTLGLHTQKKRRGTRTVEEELRSSCVKWLCCIVFYIIMYLPRRSSYSGASPPATTTSTGCCYYTAPSPLDRLDDIHEMMMIIDLTTAILSPPRLYYILLWWDTDF